MKKEKSEPVVEASPDRIDTDINTGLTSEQAAKRKSDGYDNKPVESPSKSVKEICAGNIFTGFNFLFAALSVLLIASETSPSVFS